MKTPDEIKAAIAKLNRMHLLAARVMPTEHIAALRATLSALIWVAGTDQELAFPTAFLLAYPEPENDNDD